MWSVHACFSSAGPARRMRVVVERMTAVLNHNLPDSGGRLMDLNTTTTDSTDSKTPDQEIYVTSMVRSTV